MEINEYLKLVYYRRLFGSRSWRIQVMHKVTVQKTLPYYPQVDDIGHFFVDEAGVRVELKADKTRPLLMWKDKLTLQPGDLPSITEPTLTQYGQWLVNVVGFIYPYEGALPYIASPITPNVLHQVYIKAIADGIITTRTQLRKGVDALEMLILSDSEFGVKSSSSTMMNDDKAGDKLRADMLKEYGDKINDPVIQAEFDARLIEHKKSIVATSGAKDFYEGNSKLYGTVLVKTDGRYGSETDTDGNPTKFIAKSLNEGLDLENTPEWINAATSGSYSRGSLTALSGADVKEVIRALSSLLVVPLEDCGTKVGQTVLLTKANYQMVIGAYLLGKEKEPPLTEEAAKKLIGTTQSFRAPNGCLSKNLTYCQTCMGTYTAPNGIALGVADLDSILMYMQMKAAHGYSKEVVLFNLETHFS